MVSHCAIGESMRRQSSGTGEVAGSQALRARCGRTHAKCPRAREMLAKLSATNERVAFLASPR